jgi:hypothetical protein
MTFLGMDLRDHLIRDSDSGYTVELFIVGSIASVLVIRAFLAATDYPQLGGHGLHIAHLLWGGLLMLSALLLLLIFFSVSVRWLASLLGGIGFGTFIDELGKFISQDNNYFFQPTIAILYIIFILLFLVLRAIRQPLSVREALTNRHVRNVMKKVGNTPDSQMRCSYIALRERLAGYYEQMVIHPSFNNVFGSVFITYAVVQIVSIAAIVTLSTSTEAIGPAIQATSAFLSSLCMVIGVLRFSVSRLVAYRWFHRGLLISIFVTQVFLFLEHELAALLGLGANLLLYVTVQYMIRRERAGLVYTESTMSRSPGPSDGAVKTTDESLEEVRYPQNTGVVEEPAPKRETIQGDAQNHVSTVGTLHLAWDIGKHLVATIILMGTLGMRLLVYVTANILKGLPEVGRSLPDIKPVRKIARRMEFLCARVESYLTGWIPSHLLQRFETPNRGHSTGRDN